MQMDASTGAGVRAGLAGVAGQTEGVPRAPTQSRFHRRSPLRQAGAGWAAPAGVNSGCLLFNHRQERLQRSNKVRFHKFDRIAEPIREPETIPKDTKVLQDTLDNREQFSSHILAP